MYAGTYPELPPVDSVDFSLLREEVSWYTLCVSIGIGRVDDVWSIVPSGRMVPAVQVRPTVSITD